MRISAYLTPPRLCLLPSRRRPLIAVLTSLSDQLSPRPPPATPNWSWSLRCSSSTSVKNRMSYRGRGRGRGRGGYRGGGWRGKRGSREAFDGMHQGEGSGKRTRAEEVAEPTSMGNLADLADTLTALHNQSYPAYKELRGAWRLSTVVLLVIDRIQGDAYAAPSRARLRVQLDDTGFDPACYRSRVRAIAFCDFLTRKFSRLVRRYFPNSHVVQGGWTSCKGGQLGVEKPSQHVLPRSACLIDQNQLELRFTVALPARGRTIEGHLASKTLTEVLPLCAQETLFAAKDEAKQLMEHICSVDDQDELRRLLPELGLVAFVNNGAILARRAGNNDEPMDASDAVNFKSPPGLEVSVTLASGRVVAGLGIRSGVSLVVGGGFHGKSTMLAALQLGVYDHIPGDGREFVVTVPSAMSVRAEDGRSVSCVDLTPFINNLPFGKPTSSFTTSDASGSTSQAAGIVEAVAAGAKLLLTDEDLSATNFMMRDDRMQKLVPSDKEPITPMIMRIRALYEQERVSSILVVGGAGDYFEVSDLVLMMESYVPRDVTQRAKEIAVEKPSGLNLNATPAGTFSEAAHKVRLVKTDSLVKSKSDHKPNAFAKRKEIVTVAKQELDLSAVAQLVEIGQSRALAAIIERLSEMPELESQGLVACARKVVQKMEADGLDFVNVRGERLGSYTLPREMEIHCAVNRLHGVEVRFKE